MSRATSAPLGDIGEARSHAPDREYVRTRGPAVAALRRRGTIACAPPTSGELQESARLRPRRPRRSQRRRPTRTSSSTRAPLRRRRHRRRRDARAAGVAGLADGRRTLALSASALLARRQRARPTPVQLLVCRCVSTCNGPPRTAASAAPRRGSPAMLLQALLALFVRRRRQRDAPFFVEATSCLAPDTGGAEFFANRSTVTPTSAREVPRLVRATRGQARMGVALHRPRRRAQPAVGAGASRRRREPRCVDAAAASEGSRFYASWRRGIWAPGVRAGAICCDRSLDAVRSWGRDPDEAEVRGLRARRGRPRPPPSAGCPPPTAGHDGLQLARPSTRSVAPSGAELHPGRPPLATRRSSRARSPARVSPSSLGAGSGRLRAVHAAAGGGACVLIDRKERSGAGGEGFERLCVDVASLTADDIVRATRGGTLTAGGCVVVSNHLCGAALDVALRRAVEAWHLPDPAARRLVGVLAATCCHDQCTWETYAGRVVFGAWGLGDLEFGLACRWSRLAPRRGKDDATRERVVQEAAPRRLARRRRALRPPLPPAARHGARALPAAPRLRGEPRQPRAVQRHRRQRGDPRVRR